MHPKSPATESDAYTDPIITEVMTAYRDGTLRDDEGQLITKADDAFIYAQRKSKAAGTAPHRDV